MRKVSVVTPCFNGARFLAETTRSVQAQTLTDWEHIVVDDGSTDASADLALALAAAEPRMLVVRQAKRGVAAARNRGVHAASPESAYLLFLDADDCLEPTMLEELVSYLDERPHVGLAYCVPQYTREDGSPIATGVGPGQHFLVPRYVPTRLGLTTVPSCEPETSFVSIFCQAALLPSLAVIRRTVYEDSGGWDESFGQPFEDTDLFLRIALRTTVHRLDRRLVRYRRHSVQATADTRRFAQQERKLYETWKSKSGLRPHERAVVDAADRFRQERLMPYVGLAAARRYLARGEFTRAAQFCTGAVRRYVLGLISISSSGAVGAHRSIAGT
ncbi:hypothetical protein tb265_15740 [Gemmatimonadetes bacterium T265]|nr:hypothetical protein tb265_15740 [Gemmatimonadetes bacterium T265]